MERANIIKNFKKAATTKSGKVHIVPYNGRWAIKREGGKTASFITRTQAEAISKAETLDYATAYVLHRNDGTVREIKQLR